mmetsp:Transcript_15928/g.44497  ORF Transcript_15928/g.44497 Transcript_15928/m.44497 type:complete len:151 (-) Transcript_15928:81-533(-)|eukprot:CAMPEP_0117656718 /NCGR_PEP_ID=MMETSP0804-20121206/4952_1 /TAXON_ID=1074897 /ORGANISM="Tetraselmis astigmatica, Strain CCMP880" /LENGTH=150 /DNA_ID=CAMNT_0005463135 /DNA_START=325 /DNA_END=777 /DNA_ORIENTATION=-
MASPESTVSEKVAAYERFLDERLSPELARVERQRSAALKELQDYSDLETNLATLMQSGETSFATMVDLGDESGVLCQSQVPDATKIFVKIGLGFYLECKLQEASHPIGVYKAALEKRAEALLSDVARVKADMKFVKEGIAELLQLPAENR